MFTQQIGDVIAVEVAVLMQGQQEGRVTIRERSTTNLSCRRQSAGAGLDLNRNGGLSHDRREPSLEPPLEPVPSGAESDGMAHDNGCSLPVLDGAGNGPITTGRPTSARADTVCSRLNNPHRKPEIGRA